MDCSRAVSCASRALSPVLSVLDALQETYTCRHHGRDTEHSYGSDPAASCLPGQQVSRFEIN